MLLFLDQESRRRGANDSTRGACAPQRSGYNQNAMETFQSQLTRKLSEALSSAGFPLGGEVSPATDPRFRDYQSNEALVLGKQRGENPRKIAETIIANLTVTEISEQPSV